MSPRAVEQEVPSYPSRPMLRGREEEEDEEEEEEEEEGKEEEEQGEKRFTGSHQSCAHHSRYFLSMRRRLVS